MSTNNTPTARLQALANAVQTLKDRLDTALATAQDANTENPDDWAPISNLSELVNNVTETMDNAGIE